MKIFRIACIGLVFAAVMASQAMATCAKENMGGGCGSCPQPAANDPFSKFQADTLDMRQVMMNKRFELQRENLKGAPDKAKMAGLQSEIKELQGKIIALRTKSGLPENKMDGECRSKGIQGDCANCGQMGGCGMGK